MADVYHLLAFPWEISCLWEAANMAILQPIFGPYTFWSHSAGTLLSCAWNLYHPLLPTPPCALRSFFAAERRGLKMSWREAVWRWIWCGSTCAHSAFTSPLVLWVSSPLVWLLGLKSYLPLACPCTHLAFLGRSSSSQHTEKMLKLPLQFDRRTKAFLKGGKNMTATLHLLWEDHELFLWMHSSLLDQNSVSCMSFSWGDLASICPCLSTITVFLSSDHFLLFLADHYMQVLACKHDCVRELATRSGRISPIENFLPLHYDYLQFAYYRGKGCLYVPHNVAGFCYILYTFELLHVEIRIFPHVCATVIQWHGLK